MDEYFDVNKPRSPEVLKESLEGIAYVYEGVIFDQPGLLGVTVGILNKLCGSDGRRHLLLKYLFGKASTKELTGAQKVALCTWVGAEQVEGQWLFRQWVIAEVDEVLNKVTGVIQPPLEKRLYEFD